MRIENTQQVINKVSDVGTQKVSPTSGSEGVQEVIDVSVGELGLETLEEQRKVEASDELLKKSLEQANKSLEIYDKRIERTVHEKTKTIMYTLKDTKTHEVIREFPPKKIQDMIAKMWELAGLFVDEKA